MSLGRYYVLKAIRELFLENPKSDYIEKKLVVEQINSYPEDIKKNISMIWTPNGLNDLIIILEKYGLIESYNIYEKPPRKMLKLTKMGKKFLKDNDRLYNFHKMKKEKKTNTF